MSASIVIADARIVRHGLRSTLEQRGDLAVVGEAEDGDEALAVATESRPDLMLLDLALPGRSGIEVIRALRERLPATGCLVLTMFQNGRRVRMALAAGAQGYILKTAAAEDLFDAIDTVVAGQVYLSPEIARHAIDPLTRDTPSDPLAPLTRRELQVMELVCRGQSSRGVAKFLGLSVRTADSHRSALMKKLGLHKVPDLVRLAVREGVIEP